MTGMQLDALLSRPEAVAALSPEERARVQTHIAAMLVQLGGLGMALAASQSASAPAGEAAGRFLTLREVQARLRLSKQTVARLVHTGELACVKEGRAYRVSEAALQRWQHEREREATSR